jgi:flavin-dependent dehydrogenase
MLAADVVVVGGGPAGAAAAVALGRTGLDVVLVDRARFPRDKCCGDGLTTAALRHLEALGLRPETVPSFRPVDGVTIRSPSGRTVRYPLPRGRGLYAAVARRRDLDAALVDLARDAGVKVFDGHGLTGARLDPGGGCVLAEVDGLGTVAATYVVGADGAWSPLAHALGAWTPGYTGEWQAFRSYLGGVGPAASGMWVFFEPDLLPGYAWSFPLPGGAANVGFGVWRAEASPARTDDAPGTGGPPAPGVRNGREGRLPATAGALAELLARPHVADVLGPAARPEGPVRAWPIPARIDRAALSAAGGRALFVGDAAGAADPMTGEGIAQALETGRAAAAAIAAAGPRRPTQAAARYRAAVERTLVADHRMSALLLRALRHRKGARAAVRISGATAWTRSNFARWLFEDEPRAVLLTPHRWHARFLRRDGAFGA